MEFNSIGISLSDTESVPWSEIVALHVTEVDAMTASVTILQLEHESGHYIEIHELDDAFQAALMNLASHLPLSDDWVNATKGLQARTSATIWQRV